MPPDTSGYMIVGYTIFFAVILIYLLSIYIRWRNLKQELALLTDLEREKK